MKKANGKIGALPQVSRIEPMEKQANYYNYRDSAQAFKVIIKYAF